MAKPVPPEWRSYQRWRRASWAMFLAWIPVTLLFTWVVALFSRWAGAAMFVFALSWFAAILQCLRPRYEFRCPACGELFHAWKMRGAYGLTWNRYEPFARKCVNCGLRRYTPVRGAPPS